MAERMLAKKDLRGLGTKGIPVVVPKTEGECVQRLISEHHSMSVALVGAKPKTWFGRMLWKLFGRWLLMLAPGVAETMERAGFEIGRRLPAPVGERLWVRQIEQELAILVMGQKLATEAARAHERVRAVVFDPGTAAIWSLEIKK